MCTNCVWEMAKVRHLTIFLSTFALALLYITLVRLDVRFPVFPVEWRHIAEIRHGSGAVKVLLIAYGRSGSSLAGELLSFSPGSRYYFEPLFFVKDIQQMNRRKDFSHLSLYLLESLFNCSLEAVDQFLLLSLRNPGWRWKYYSLPPCDDNDQVQVAKVIRFQLDHDALGWLRSRHDIKVVHWVRDPRGMLNSVLGAPSTDNFQTDPWLLCDRMWSDIFAIDSLPSDQWRRVSYEEMVSDPIEVTRGLYRFLGIPWPSDGDKQVLTHFAPDPQSMASTNGYYSTYRNGSAFDPHHWKQEMNEVEIALTERECGTVMDALGYQREVVTGPLPIGWFEERFMVVPGKSPAEGPLPVTTPVPDVSGM
ncbi:unnamed protein product [Darwinula stevensoni]|uniref:Sulfotransferase n=1 Tax=Darwinula stevensoni TaxID=69355 RepID=A0A7R9FR18_9CRUS|nr:unnamed protein product [Darwinula stevensoni]CAG0900790.1 unnamed protein product [Darwinula stevensoni]